MRKFCKFDKFLILPIIAGILYLPHSIVANLTEVKNHYIIYSICSSLGMSLSIIPLLISRIKMRNSMSNKNLIRELNEKNKIKESKLQIELIYNKSINEIKRYKFLYIFFSSLIDFFESLLAAIIINSDIKINFWILDILFLSFLSYLILKTHLFKHQIISMIIIIIIGIIIDLLFGNLKDAFHNIFFIITRTFCEFCYSLSQIINKYCMDVQFSPPYEVCFFIGVFSFFFFSISLIISSNIPCTLDYCSIQNEKTDLRYFDNFMIYISKFNIKELFLFILDMIIIGLINILNILTIKYFTPCHSIIIVVIGRIILNFEKIIFDFDLSYILYIILLIFTLFGILVYVEIIELKICGIQNYTNNNIEKRGIEDINLAIRETSSESFINESEDNELEEVSITSKNSSEI